MTAVTDIVLSERSSAVAEPVLCEGSSAVAVLRLKSFALCLCIVNYSYRVLVFAEHIADNFRDSVFSSWS